MATSTTYYIDGLLRLPGRDQARDYLQVNVSNTAAAAPANPQQGQVYYNTTDNHFYGWNGAAWVQLD